MKPTATAIVTRYLAIHGVPVTSADPEEAFYCDGVPVSWGSLTRFVWLEFHEAPAQSAIHNAYAVLKSLAEVK
jgi:hypothetical protein